jgi:hypothetical protein
MSVPKASSITSDEQVPDETPDLSSGRSTPRWAPARTCFMLHNIPERQLLPISPVEERARLTALGTE